jgi:hypothetical protein
VLRNRNRRLIDGYILWSVAGKQRAGGSRRGSEEMKARRLIESSSYGPNTLHVIFQAFDQAWAEIADNFRDDARDIEQARMRLAHAILAVAWEDNDADGLKDAALQVMALSYAKRW